jgi:FkbM family methyltransferase
MPAGPVQTGLNEWLVGALRPVLVRGKPRLLRKIVPSTGVRTTDVFGFRLKLDLANFIDRMIFMGCYEPANTHRFKRTLKPGQTVIDVGANIGYFTLLAARLTGPGGRVIAVEPHPTNFGLLKETLETNKLKQVTALEIGLGEREGTGRVHMADQVQFPNRTASMVSSEAWTSFPVRVRALDDCLDDWGIETVDLLKIDVDGFESRIISGSAESLGSGRIKNLIIEFNDFWLKKAGDSALALKARIEALGFEQVNWWLSDQLLGPTHDHHFRWSGSHEGVQTRGRYKPARVTARSRGNDGGAQSVGADPRTASISLV